MEIQDAYKWSSCGSDQISLKSEILSESEKRVAEEYTKGLSDKEVADNLCKSYWTVKTQKKMIYHKLGITKDTELLWWMICERLRINFNLKEIRKHGISILLIMLLTVMEVSCKCGDLRRGRSESRARTETRVRDGNV